MRSAPINVSNKSISIIKKHNTHPHSPFNAFALGTVALLDLLTPQAAAASASSAFLRVASSLCSFVQTFGGEGGVADERFDLGLFDLRGLPFFLATRTRVRAVLEPRQMRSSARSAAHCVTVAGLFL